MLMPHSIIHGDACFAYFNKIWGIPYMPIGPTHTPIPIDRTTPMPMRTDLTIRTPMLTDPTTPMHTGLMHTPTPIGLTTPTRTRGMVGGTG